MAKNGGAPSMGPEGLIHQVSQPWGCETGELSQHLTNCSTWESEPHILTGWQSGAGSGDVGVAEQALGT